MKKKQVQWKSFNINMSEELKPIYDFLQNELNFILSNDAEIEIEIVFSNSTSYIYRNNNNAEIKSITTVINYLFTHLNDFPNMTKDEFINHLKQHLDEDFKD